MPSVESHQDILFDINSFGGFLNLLIYDFGNIDKQDPVFHFGRNFIFFHIIRQQDTLHGKKGREKGGEERRKILAP